MDGVHIYSLTFPLFNATNKLPSQDIHPSNIKFLSILYFGYHRFGIHLQVTQKVTYIAISLLFPICTACRNSDDSALTFIFATEDTQHENLLTANHTNHRPDTTVKARTHLGNSQRKSERNGERNGEQNRERRTFFWLKVPSRGF